MIYRSLNLRSVKASTIHLKVFTSGQIGALERLKTLHMHAESSFEPGLWHLALRRFNFDLGGMQRRASDKNVMIVALQNKYVIGFLLMSSANSRLSPNPKIELNGCITFEVNITSVSEKHRRGGIGRQIANKMLTVVGRLLNEETSIGFVLLKSTPNARTFWENIGFSRGYPDDLIESAAHMKTTLEYAGYDYYIQVWYDD